MTPPRVNSESLTEQGSRPALLVFCCASIIFLGEAGECWESYYSLFEEAVEPSALEIFNYLFDKLLAPDIGRADPALRLRAVLGGLIHFPTVFQISITSILTQSCYRAPSSSHCGDVCPKESIWSSPLHGVLFHPGLHCLRLVQHPTLVASF